MWIILDPSKENYFGGDRRTLQMDWGSNGTIYLFSGNNQGTP
jgi:hypothetical protein